MTERYLDDIKEALNLSRQERDYTWEGTIPISDGELRVTHYQSSRDDHRETIQIEVYRKGLKVGGFTIGEGGLEDVGFTGLTFSIGESEIELEGGMGVGFPGSLTTHMFIGEDKNNYRRMAEPLVDWVKQIVERDEVGEVVPFKITHKRKRY